MDNGNKRPKSKGQQKQTSKKSNKARKTLLHEKYETWSRGTLIDTNLASQILLRHFPIQMLGIPAPKSRKRTEFM